MKKYYPVITTIYDNGSASVVMGTPEAHTEKPKTSVKHTSICDTWVDWFDSLADAQQFIKENQ